MGIPQTVWIATAKSGILSDLLALRYILEPVDIITLNIILAVAYSTLTR
jgi:hypothetical protein